MSAYITRKESREAVGVAFGLGIVVGGLLVSVAQAFMVGACV